MIPVRGWIGQVFYNCSPHPTCLVVQKLDIFQLLGKYSRFCRMVCSLFKNKDWSIQYALQVVVVNLKCTAQLCFFIFRKYFLALKKQLTKTNTDVKRLRSIQTFGQDMHYTFTVSLPIILDSSNGNRDESRSFIRVTPFFNLQQIDIC